MKDLIYLFHIYSPLCGIRICNDGSYYQFLRRFLVIFFAFYCCYSMITGEVLQIRYQKSLNINLLERLSSHSWSFLNALSIFFIPKYLYKFFNKFKDLNKLCNLDMCYFRNKMAKSHFRIRWTLTLCYSFAAIYNVMNMIKSIHCQDTIWKKIRAIVTFLPTFEAFIILYIIESIVMYFGCYYQNLYYTIQKTSNDLDNKSEKEKIKIICSIRIIYQQLTECIMIAQILISPLMLLLIIYLAPDMIIIAPSLFISFNFSRIFLIFIVHFAFIFSMLTISWISTYYTFPYNSVYQLSFDCKPQQLKMVRIFELIKY